MKISVPGEKAPYESLVKEVPETPEPYRQLAAAVGCQAELDGRTLVPKPLQALVTGQKSIWNWVTSSLPGDCPSAPSAAL